MQPSVELAEQLAEYPPPERYEHEERRYDGRSDLGRESPPKWLRQRLIVYCNRTADSLEQNATFGAISSSETRATDLDAPSPREWICSHADLKSPCDILAIHV